MYRWTGKPWKTVLASSTAWTWLSGVSWEVDLQSDHSKSRNRDHSAGTVHDRSINYCCSQGMGYLSEVIFPFGHLWIFPKPTSGSDTIKKSSSVCTGIDRFLKKKLQSSRTFSYNWNTRKSCVVLCDTVKCLKGFWSCLFKVFTSSLDVESWQRDSIRVSNIHSQYPSGFLHGLFSVL